MSDPHGNMEYQDVLSSIRRLVSEEKRAPARDRRNEAREVQPPASEDKLVLTAALRVRGSEAEASGGALQAGTVASPGRASLENTVAELEAAVALGGEDFEPESGGDGSEADAGRNNRDGADAAEDTSATEAGEETRRLNLTARDLVAGEADAESLGAPEEAAQEPQPDVAHDGVTEAEMEILRDLVAEIIREELRGPLGERITRNLRMLVRREMKRALEIRNLD